MAAFLRCNFPFQNSTSRHASLICAPELYNLTYEAADLIWVALALKNAKFSLDIYQYASKTSSNF
ncbi:hypothetical protein CW354_02375 [Marinicaulis flavus]|uniref:Uncharacterized protein n=1 Tax=Hyphococcus luteus TaxID=2058213 RepID=A0A2S7KB25_9PROT|nr:hypothetical protein CW354_02375 [Marinicaulis flavus]